MKIGDLISVLDETTTGKIISVGKNSVKIEDDFGFEQEIEISKIILRNDEIYKNSKIIIKKENLKKSSKKKGENSRTLDLHFENLVKNPTEYSSWERLEIQKEKLLEEIDYCRKNYIKKINVIHGIGDGVLQEMVYDILRGQTGIEFEENEFFHHSSGNVWVIFK
ncbi:Smr/MutS family protein [Halpernia sp.]|uniref:Smr/MutS family protein n=1 Tax=Halpernia sp. TaxID=2782209 RepID=UPI003A93E2DA